MSQPSTHDLALLDTLFDAAAVGLAVTDGDLRYTRVNAAFAAMSGRSVAEHVGLPVGDLAVALEPEIEPLCRRVLATGASENAVEIGPAGAQSDLDRRWIAGFHPIRGDGGRVTGVAIVAVDVAAQHRAIRELAAQQSFLRQVIDLDPNFVFAKDRQGRFTLVNLAVAEAYGTTVERLIGKTDADFNPNADEVEHFRRDDLEVMDSKRDKVIPEEAITDAQGRVRWLQTVKRAIVSPDGTVDQVLGVANDITIRKNIEEQLPQAQKMEAIGLLAGGVAHDFNNLLTVILGSVDMMTQRLDAGHPMRANAEEIRRAAERAAMLTQQLLAFGRKQVLQPRVVELGKVVTESAEMLRRVIGEDVELVTQFSPDLGNVEVDPGQVTQVILNLAINARDAMPRGGRITIEASNVTLDAAFAAGKPDTRPGEYVMIAVADEGEGIPPAVLPRIFEPFFTTKPSGHGTGLGLATSYGIVRQSGGHIWVASEVGRGTTFRVYLPRVHEAPSACEPFERPTPAPSTGRETVLLVEDEAMVRGVASRALRHQGYTVLEAANGVEALEVARKHPGPIHLLLTDVVMPSMGGPELVDRLHETMPALKALFTSGYSESFALGGVPHRAASFLAKPYLPSALTRRVREVLDAG